MKCRFCHRELTHTFLDLGFAPPSNAYLSEEDLSRSEKYFPLRVKVCDNCWLVQTEDYTQADQLFREDYAYFSSTSTGWLAHAALYARDISRDLALSEDSMVVEIASNDGYLLKNFLAAQIPCYGVEPTANTAAAAEALGISVVSEFFGEELALELAGAGRQADLLIGNNVFAHVPDINDFTRGLKTLLKPGGTVTLEFPHLLRLVEYAQFDTVYHEHFSYLSLFTVRRIFAAAGMDIYKVEELKTHGGSLRIYGCHADDRRGRESSVNDILFQESSAGMREVTTYHQFQSRANSIKDHLLTFLIEQKRLGKKVVGYGAAAKGNTLLNYAGVKPDLLSCVCDAAPSKQGKYLPGSHIPVVAPSLLAELAADFILILPWNIADEVRAGHASLVKDGARHVTAVPTLEIL
ncbi:MAG: class I SAM-dependent methyltransferase [Halioglobus sp.]